MRLPKKLSAAAVLCFTVLVCPVAHAGVDVVTYLGGPGDDEISSAAIMSDGSIVVGGKSTSATIAGVAGTKLVDSTGFVAKLNAAGTSILWLVRVPQVKKVEVGPHDNIYLLLDRSVAVLKADGSGFLSRGPDLGATTVSMDAAPDGSVAVLDAVKARLIGPDGAELWSKAVGRDHLLSVALDPVNKDVWVGGDQNTNTGFEPYRSPFLYRYTAVGDRTTVLWNWSGPSVRADGKQLQADSFITFLKFAADGRLWIGAGSDGGNTVLTKEPDNLDVNQDALSGACFSGPCFGYKGAKKTGLFGKMKAPVTDMERASWVIPYVGMDPGSHLDPPCGCKGGNFNAASGVNPGSFGVGELLPTPHGVIVLGNPWGKGSATVNGWFYNTIYPGGGIGWMGVFDSTLASITQASMIPGTRNAVGDYRNGKLAVTGRAADFSSATVDPREAGWHLNLPTTQNALQKTYGGGASDGYLIIATMDQSAVENASRFVGQGRRMSRVAANTQGQIRTEGLAGYPYVLTTTTGAVVQRGLVPPDGMISLKNARALGACVLRVTERGRISSTALVTVQ